MKAINTATVIISVLVLAGTGCKQAGKGESSNGGLTLAAARKNFHTRIVKTEGAQGEVETPPADMFSVVEYPSGIGKMPAYLSHVPDDGQLHPAMIWITGGFGNDIGDVWTPQEQDNDQSAAVIRHAGVVMMYPAQRGGNTSPGSDESCYGEVDDIIAAADFLSKQKGIDPKRIYLGGHSTGGTKAILVAECSNKFRAVFSLGPAAAIADYGKEHFTFDESNKKEFELREPIRWLSSLSAPLYVFEGTAGNIDALKDMKDQAIDQGNKLTHFYEVKDKDHFSEILPVTTLIAQKISADNKAGDVQIDFEQDVKGIR